MNIFYASGASANTFSIPESRVWESNLYKPLGNLGHKVVKISIDVTKHFVLFPNYKFDERQREQFMNYREFIEKTLFEEIKRENHKEKIDVLFTYFWDDICTPEVIREIRGLGIVTINWYCNASYQFDKIKGLAPAYDYCLVPERFRLEDYLQIGAKPMYIQEAANPDIYRPYPVEYKYDATFIGSRYGDRPAFVKYLFDSGINIHVFGPGWRQNFGSKAVNKLKNLFSYKEKEVFLPDSISGPILKDEEMIKMSSRSRVNLGFSACGNTHLEKNRILQIRLRDFEVPMSGGFYMVEFQEELKEFYEIGKEIVCYYDRKDLADKIKYYLQHDSERENIRQAGMRRARNEHTWQNRFKEVFRQIGLN
jgi:spore maturation protein CgeB